jgi:hypothetical protein
MSIYAAVIMFSERSSSVVGVIKAVRKSIIHLHFLKLGSYVFRHND